MLLEPFVDTFRDEMSTAANAAGPEARDLAERLSAAVASAARLVLLEALAGAADEITREMAPGSVEVRLRGRDPEFVVTPAPATAAQDEEAGSQSAGAWSLPPVVTGEDDDATSRLNLRLPESLKQRIEEAARQEGLSLNAWLVRAAAVAAEPDRLGRRGPRRTPTTGGQNYTGWVS